MPGKAKAQKHTAAELNAKATASKQANGGAQGGAVGKEVRQSTSVKVMLHCTICGQPNFSGIADIRVHYDSKHPKATVDEAAYDAMKIAAKEQTKEKIKIEALRTYLFAYASIYDAFHLDQLQQMFDLEARIVHSIVSKMMIKDEITAFWDESSKFVLVQHVEPTPLQRLALTLADRGAQAVENNERLVDQKAGGYGFKEAQGGGRWDQDGGKGGQRRYGKGGGGFEGGKGKGKGGKRDGKNAAAISGPPRNRGWENARAGALRGSTQRGWATNKPA